LNILSPILPGSLQRLKEAGLEEIAAVEGMNRAVAVSVFEWLHGIEE